MTTIRIMSDLIEVGGMLLGGLAMAVVSLGLFLFFDGRHVHDPVETGRRIYGVYGKDNLPQGEKPIQSIGREATCNGCPERLIIHDAGLPFCDVMTEIECQI